MTNHARFSALLWGLSLFYLLVLSLTLLGPQPLWYLGPLQPDTVTITDSTLSTTRLHFLAFGALTLLVYHAARSTCWPQRGVALSLLVAYSLVTECVQSFIPGRFCETGDIAANVLGILLAWIISHRTTPWPLPR